MRLVWSPAVLVLIDLSAGGVTLRDPSDFTRFSVALTGDGDLDAALRGAGLGRPADDGRHFVVDPAALRTLAGSAADAAWEEGFAGMCAYAASNGWVEPGGGLLAHIEPGSGAVRD
jgi:hypothetical protein